jgi:hypothetical protein
MDNLTTTLSEVIEKPMQHLAEGIMMNGTRIDLLVSQLEYANQRILQLETKMAEMRAKKPWYKRVFNM